MGEQKMECEGTEMEADGTPLAITSLKESQKRRRSFYFESCSGKLRQKKKPIRHLSNTTTKKR